MSYLKLKDISKCFGPLGNSDLIEGCGANSIEGGTDSIEDGGDSPQTSVALSLVNLAVEEYQIMVVLGPSGCGKSTLLRIIAGLETPDSGRVFLAGNDITDKNPKDRNIAMVFQDYALYPHMTVERNMTFGLTTRGMKKKEAVKQARDAAGLLGISQLLKKKPGQLSGGEKQRLALGRAIVKSPSLFLMDEPLSNVDALLRVKMRSEISRIIKEVKGTMVFVTHDQIEAMTMGDVLAVMNDGTIEQVGTPREIYQSPKNIFVARFIGSPNMNLIEPATGLHGIIAKSLADNIVLKGNRDFSEIIFGIRPEEILCKTDSSKKGKNVAGQFEGEVKHVEELGYESHVTVFAQGVDVTIRMNADKGATPLSPGDVRTFSLNEKGLHFFDKSTGNRVDTKQ
jgi:ABC-type sugar transport system ATPase subunit